MHVLHLFLARDVRVYFNLLSFKFFATLPNNLLDAPLQRAENVLHFLDDLSVPCTNNQAERDLLMIKVQQKISGTFRSIEDATAFCIIRSYLSTMRKQGRSMFGAIAAVFAGTPFSVAWDPK